MLIRNKVVLSSYIIINLKIIDQLTMILTMIIIYIIVKADAETKEKNIKSNSNEAIDSVNKDTLCTKPKIKIINQLVNYPKITTITIVSTDLVENISKNNIDLWLNTKFDESNNNTTHEELLKKQ